MWIKRQGGITPAGSSPPPHTLSHWPGCTDSRNRWDDRSMLAQLINLYNLTIQAVLKAYPIASIRPRAAGLGLPNWNYPAFWPLWRTQATTGLRSNGSVWPELRTGLLRSAGRSSIHFAMSARHWAARCCARRPNRPELVEPTTGRRPESALSTIQARCVMIQKNILILQQEFFSGTSRFSDEHTSLSHTSAPSATSSKSHQQTKC